MATEATDMGRTTIQVTDELADELHSRKDRGDSYEDVIWRLIEEQDDVEPVTAGETTDTERKAEVYDDLAEESAAGDARDVEEHDAGDVQDDVEAFVERVSDTWEDTEERLASRRAAAEVVLQHALDTGDAVGKSSDVVEDVRERFPVEGQNEETYWRKNIRPVLKEAGEYSQAHHGYVVEALGEEE
jgi:predicted CopG family antitoxin